MDFVQDLNYITIDSDGFEDGIILGAAISEINAHSVAIDPPPGLLLGPFERWRWVSNQWVATIDYRGHSWYNPGATDEVHQAARFDDAPPPGWIYWAPGENRVVGAAEQIAQRWGSVRQERDELLAQSDWVVTKSVEQGVPVPVEWVQYRQALRDITEQADPFGIVWPLRPGRQYQGLFTVGAM